MLIYGFREREMVLAFFEKTTGLRMNTNYIRLGASPPTCPTAGRTTLRSSARRSLPAPTSTTTDPGRPSSASEPRRWETLAAEAPPFR